MIDLHCHVLPGIDDGPNALGASLQMVRIALEDGIDTIVATPHVNLRYGVEPAAIAAAVEDLRAALAGDELALSLHAGAEIALSRLAALDDDQIRALCLGRSSYALVESPYRPAGALIEESLFSLQVRGFRPLLAHPERCPEFQRDVARLERLVATEVACSISAGSMVGQFGEPVRRFASRLCERGLVHNVSSDAHDPVKRSPRLRAAFRRASAPFADLELQDWLTRTVPAAILADEPLPPMPRTQKPSRWRRMTTRG